MNKPHTAHSAIERIAGIPRTTANALILHFSARFFSGHTMIECGTVPQDSLFNIDSP